MESTPHKDPRIGLGVQFRRNLWLYVGGAVFLAAQQFFMAKRDFLVRDAVNAAEAMRSNDAVRDAFLILGVSVAAFVVRVSSRWTMFTGGRNAEYELRGALLSHLHRLGPAFFRKMPTGDIMSRDERFAAGSSAPRLRRDERRQRCARVRERAVRDDLEQWASHARVVRDVAFVDARHALVFDADVYEAEAEPRGSWLDE